MTKSRLGNNPLKALNGTGERIDVHGRKMSRSVQYVQTNLLKPNALNARFFKELTIDELSNLVENIKTNGIHTPLIARHDYTLIAGHNRLQAAKELELQHVPVQFVEDEMTEQEEIKFIISDNLLRRHLSNSEKIELYRVLFPNFDERVKMRLNTNAEPSVDSVHTQDFTPLTAFEIAQQTGQTKQAVQKQLQRDEARSRRESEQNHRTQQEVAVTSAAKSQEMMRAREREADRALKSAVTEIALQLQRTDVSEEWRRTAMQRTLRDLEKTRKALPA